MAHFAQLDENNIVTRVIVVSNSECKDINGDEIENIGISFCQKIFGGDTNWKQTSYNASFRGNYAGIGFTYMENVQTLGVASTDIFIPQQPYPSWSIGIQTANWYSPLGRSPYRTDEDIANGLRYRWDEDAYQADNTTGWVLRDYENPS